MSELSMIGKIIKALEIAKQAGVGVEFSKFDAIELLGHIKNMEEAYELIEHDLARLTRELEDERRWIPVSEGLPKSRSKILVTNNINARNAYGEMSHVWLVSMIHKEMDGSFSAFDDADRQIHDITYYRLPRLPKVGE